MIDEVLQKLKDKHGDIFSATIGQTEYYFRALTLTEINRLVSIAGEKGSAELEDLYVEHAVVYPENIDWDSVKPGFITRLAEEIQFVSGTGDATFIFETLFIAREEFLNDITMMMIAFIMTAIPIYTEEQLKDLTLKDLIHKITLAEQIMNFQQSINGVENPDIRFQLRLAGDEPEKKQNDTLRRIPGSETPPPKPQQKRSELTKEQLLSRIRGDEKAGREFLTQEEAANIREMETFDEDLLVKASGSLRPDDPIARRLWEASR